jgi:hypothetical protein
MTKTTDHTQGEQQKREGSAMAVRRKIKEGPARWTEKV